MEEKRIDPVYKPFLMTKTIAKQIKIFNTVFSINMSALLL
jgi:hypothetical protein